MATSFNWHRPASSAPVGSVKAEQMLLDGVRELADALRDGIEIFVEQLPDASGAS
jgi:hypothetical protein